jgi:hypothetical protein
MVTKQEEEQNCLDPHASIRQGLHPTLLVALVLSYGQCQHRYASARFLGTRDISHIADVLPSHQNPGL